MCRTTVIIATIRLIRRMAIPIILLFLPFRLCKWKASYVIICWVSAFCHESGLRKRSCNCCGHWDYWSGSLWNAAAMMSWSWWFAAQFAAKSCFTAIQQYFSQIRKIGKWRVQLTVQWRSFGKNLASKWFSNLRPADPVKSFEHTLLNHMDAKNFEFIELWFSCNEENNVLLICRIADEKHCLLLYSSDYWKFTKTWQFHGKGCNYLVISGCARVNKQILSMKWPKKSNNFRKKRHADIDTCQTKYLRNS